MPMAGCHKSRGKYIVTGMIIMNDKLTFDIVEHTEFPLGAGLLIIPVFNGISESSKTLYLEKTSLEIWKDLSNNYCISEISSHISQLYDKDLDIITEDVQEFIDDLLRTGYIIIKNGELYE